MVDAWGVRRTDMEGYDGVPRRTIFILDPEMKVRWRWVTSPEQRLPDTDQVLAEARKIGGDDVGAGKRAKPAKPAARLKKKT
jgi:peroxiredoxin